MNLLQNNETKHLGVLKGRPYHIGGFNLRKNQPQILFFPQSAFQIYTNEIRPMEML